MNPFQTASGLSRQQFLASEKELTPAFQSVALSRSSTSLPTTPRKNAMYRNFIPSSSSTSGSLSSPTKSSIEMTPEAKLQRAKDVMSGAAFVSNKSSPLSNRLRGNNSDHGYNSTPQTPTSRRLRDRSSIKETHIFDPSDIDNTPTKKRVVLATPTSAHVDRQSRKRPQEAMEEELTPRKVPSLKRRHRILIGYPAGEPLRRGGFEVMGEWDGSHHCKERLNRYLEALQHCQDLSGWEPYEVMGEINLSI